MDASPPAGLPDQIKATEIETETETEVKSYSNQSSTKHGHHQRDPHHHQRSASSTSASTTSTNSSLTSSTRNSSSSSLSSRPPSTINTTTTTTNNNNNNNNVNPTTVISGAHLTREHSRRSDRRELIDRLGANVHRSSSGYDFPQAACPGFDSSSSSSPRSSLDHFDRLMFPHNAHHQPLLTINNSKNNNNNSHHHNHSSASSSSPSCSGSDPKTKVYLLLIFFALSALTPFLQSVLTTTRLIPLSILTFPLLEFALLSITTPLLLWIRPADSPTTSLLLFSFHSPAVDLSSSSPPHHNSPSIPRFTSWRLTLRYTLPIALCLLTSSWSRAELAAQLGLGASQLLDIYALPIATILISRHPLMSQPNKELYALSSLIACAVSLVLLNQIISPANILLGILCSGSEAIYLISLKTWLLSFPQASPLRALAHSAPVSLLCFMLPCLFNTFYRTISAPSASLDVTPRLTVGTTVWLILFTFLRVAERLLQLTALFATVSPLSILLLTPSRNVFSVCLAGLSQVYIGINGLAQLLSVYCLWLPSLLVVEEEAQHVACVSLSTIKHLSLPITTLPMFKDQLSHREKYEQPKEDRAGHCRRSPSKMSGSEDEHGLLYPRQLSYHDTTHSNRIPLSWRRISQLVAFGPLLGVLILRLLTPSIDVDQPHPSGFYAQKPTRPSGSLDLVFSYYNEPMNTFIGAISYVRQVPQFAARSPRVIIYVKHPNVSLEHLADVTNADEVVRLPNVGREGGTYLTHILRHHNGTIGARPWRLRQSGLPPFATARVLRTADLVGLADHTIFMQPDISWSWIARPRMEIFDHKRTGFLSFGPYFRSECGEDGLGNGNYERMRDIYALFHHTFCPPKGQLASYAGQFIVSRKRILRNDYRQYQGLKDILEAKEGHWIHGEGSWLKWKGATDQGASSNPTGPQAPFLGHALERSWPSIFQCDSERIIRECTDDNPQLRHCQCFD